MAKKIAPEDDRGANYLVVQRAAEDTTQI